MTIRTYDLFLPRLFKVWLVFFGIISIGMPILSQFGFLVFRYSGGRVVIANQCTGFHQLLSEMAARNPGVELLGC